QTAGALLFSLVGEGQREAPDEGFYPRIRMESYARREPLARLRSAKPPSPTRGPQGERVQLELSACFLRPRRAADVDHVAVAGGGILVDEAGDQDAAVEGDDLAVLLARRGTRRSDVVLAARRTLQPQFLRRRLVGEMHDHAAGRAGGDHVGILALGPGRSLGTGAVGRVLERGEAPAADD